MAELEAPRRVAGTRPTLGALLSAVPPRTAPPVEPEWIASELRRTGTTLLVIDDDPTGSQAVAGVPLITSWSAADLRWALGRGNDVAFVLTNSRALDDAAAVAVNHEVGQRARRVAGELGRALVVVSRGDSMLRGHFPAETLALDAGLQESGAAPLDAIVVCPAFPEAGRHTIDGTHWAANDDGTACPAAETEFAADPVFGYDESDLRAWVVARGAGRWREDEVAAVTLRDLRVGGPEHVAQILGAVRGGRPVACDAADEQDLLTLAAGIALAERRGRRIVYRTGPSFVAARAGRRRPAPISGPIATGTGVGTLVVVGSHTALTTRQLDRARARHHLRVLELDVAAIASSDNAAGREVRQLADRAVSALAAGDVAISTGRAEMTAPTVADSVRLKSRIARAVVDVTREVVARRRPAALIAKGGITAHQLAGDALGARRAIVRGQLFPGQVSVWQLEDCDLAPGLPYVVFPGNVGGTDTLADAITRTKEAR